MQVTVEDLSPVKKLLHIEVPEDETVRELDRAYQNLKQTAKIKGFRPGKVPRGVLERLFKKDVLADVSSKLIQSSFVDAIKETDLKIVGSPKIDPPELAGKGPYKYDATVEIAPEIESIDFKGLHLKKTLYRVGDKEVEAQLKMLQKNLATLKPMEEDRPIRQDDFALIDYEGFKDGKPFNEIRKTENFTMKIGGGHILKDFDEKMIGMRPGDTREITVRFPEDYFNKKLADVEATFRVTLKEIRQEVLPEVDDELAKKLGKYENLETLKKDIQDNLKQGYEKRVEQEVNEQIFSALIAQTDFEVPEVLVEYELGGIIAEAEKSFAYHNMPMDKIGLTREKLAEKYQPVAEKQVRRHLILSKIIEQENLTLSDDELEAGFKEMSEAFHQPVEEIKTYYRQNQDRLEFFKQTLLEKHAIKLIIESGKIEEVEPEADPEIEKEPENA